MPSKPVVRFDFTTPTRWRPRGPAAEAYRTMTATPRMAPLLRLARSRDIAAEVAARLATGAGEEVVVASSGMASAIASELLSRLPHGVAGVRLQTLNDLARRIVNDAGDYPRVAGEAERRLAMRTAARAIDDPMMESRGMAAMLERSYRDVRDAGVTLADFDARARRATLRNARRTQLVMRAWREYERLIAQSGAIDDDDARLLNRFAAELGFATTATIATPLLAHRLGRGLATILRLRDRGFARGDVFELLRDGFTPRRRMKIDDVDLATRRARVAGGTASELQNVARKPMLEDYVAVVAELEQIAPPAVLRGGEWSEALASLNAGFRLETDLDVEAGAAMDEVCALFRRWPSARFEAGLVIDAIEQHEIGKTSAAGVIVSDVMSFRGRSVEHLFAIRMQDDLFPQRRVDDPLLPDADRRELRLRQIGDGRDEERLLFELLFDAAGASVQFSYPSGDGFGKVLRKSPFLRMWSAAAMPPPSRAAARPPHSRSL